MTDWNDIGAVTRLFGEERDAVNRMLGERAKKGRNFWREAADEIERLRKRVDELERARPDYGSRACT